VAVGVGARSGHDRIDAALVVAVSLALLITIGLWWTYFDRFAAAAERRLREHPDPVLAAADSYSYLHLLLVAGIIVFAVGAKFAIAHVAAPLSDAARLALCGGVALYLAGHFAFRLRITGELRYAKLLAALACMAVFALAGGLDAWAVASLLVAVLALLLLGERREPVEQARAAGR
jgi:low temperature requirement protein LtrA